MITVIAAVSEDGFVGKEGNIPWRVKNDLDHFRAVTTGHSVVMGRKTWDSLRKFRPLPNRRNIVLTRQKDFLAEGTDVVHSVREALELTENEAHVFFMGGAEVYQQVLPLAERLLLTRVRKVVGDGDAKFPDMDSNAWNLVSKTEMLRATDDECDFAIEHWSPNLKYIELANIRTPEQLRVMRQIRTKGHCPFCRENLHLYHQKPITWEGKHWLLTENQWPYPGMNVHLLFILKRHKENLGCLSRTEQLELFLVIRKLETEGLFLGGGIGIRSGDPILSGATVKHLHAQIISPKRGSEPVKFYIGTDLPRAVP